MNVASMENNSYSKWYSAVLGSVFFLALFDLKGVGILKLNVLPILFLAITALVVTGAIKKQLRFQVDKLSIAFAAFYLLYVIYAVFTRHPDQASSYFENKLSFILLPVLFSFKPRFNVNYSPLIYGWVLGCVALCGVSFMHSYQCSQLGLPGAYVASLFSYVHHPTYSSFYYTTALFLAIYAYKNNIKGFTLIPTILVSGLLLFSIFLCISLAGLLFLMLAIAVSIFFWIGHKWGRTILVLSIVVSPFLLYGVIKAVPRLNGEWSNAMGHVNEYFKEPSTYVKNCRPPHEGTQTRIIMWTVASAACMDYPMGVGTGNVDEVLAFYQRKYNQADMVQYQYNPHNQFLQTWLEIGIFGLLILLTIIGLSVAKAIQTKNWLLLLVAGNLFFNCLFESMLQRQSGIFYYTIVLLILYQVKVEVTNSRKIP